jgi:hypothetical protein
MRNGVLRYSGLEMSVTRETKMTTRNEETCQNYEGSHGHKLRVLKLFHVSVENDGGRCSVVEE